MKIAAIDHIVLRTSRLDDMLDFYCRVLGCRVERESGPEIGLVQLRAGNALIDLVTVDGELGRRGGGPPGRGENNLDHFCLRLETVSEAEISEHLVAHGVEAGDFEQRYGAEGIGGSIYIEDPEGNTVELRAQRAGD